MILFSYVKRIFAYFVLLIICIIAAAPILYLGLLSTKRRIDILDVPPSLHIDWNRVQINFVDVLFDRNFLHITGNSIFVTAMTTLFALIIGVPAAYGFSRIPLKNVDRWTSTILSFRFMPAVATAVPIMLMMRFLHIHNTFAGLIIPYVAFSLPLVIWIMMGFFHEIPKELDESAQIDGCSRWDAFKRVILPLVVPGIAVSAIFTTIFIWNEFMVGLYLLSSDELKTVPIAASGLISAQRPIDWNVAAAIGVFTIIPLLLLSVIIQKYLVRGLTSGSLK